MHDLYSISTYNEYEEIVETNDKIFRNKIVRVTKHKITRNSMS